MDSHISQRCNMLHRAQSHLIDTDSDIGACQLRTFVVSEFTFGSWVFESNAFEPLANLKELRFKGYANLACQ